MEMESEITLEDIINFFEINKMDKKYLDIIEKNNFWYWPVDNLQKLLDIFEDEYWHEESLYRKKLERAEKDFLVLKKVKYYDELSAEQKKELNTLLDGCEAINKFLPVCDDRIYYLRKAVEILIDLQTNKT